MLPVGRALLGKFGYGVACVAASGIFLAAGAGYYAQHTAENFGTSNVLTGGQSTGAMNILIMGLESRTYWDGTSIDHHLAVVMNTGTAANNNGGEQTNTLILLHIFAGGQKAVAFSIPRDDYVKLYGTLGYAGTPPYNKIDDAYNAAMQQELINDQKDHPTWTRAQDNLDANDAGRLATVETVEALTGVNIDKFAELNLVGFYELAAAFGGIEACVKYWPGGDGLTAGENLSDPVTGFGASGQGSGWKGRAGYQLLSPAQTLAFVRDRHTVPGGDVGRTYRQMAVIDYVLWRLKTQGALADVGRLSSLMSTAQNFLAVPRGWNLLQFAGEMNALTGHNVTFAPLPETPGPDIPGIGSVNDVDVSSIQRIVRQAFSAPSGSGITAPDSAGQGGSSKTGRPSAPARRAAQVPPASSVTVDVDNAGAPRGLAHSALAALAARGYKQGVAQNAATTQPLTAVTYGSGAAANAAVIARYFGATATASSSVPAGHVLVLLGGATLSVPVSLGGPRPTATPASTPASSAAAGTSPGGSTGSVTGGPAAVAANARYGIPCVY